jgi:hypothetical protein
MTVRTIKLKKGERYWVNFAGDDESCHSAKILDLISQEGQRLVRFRVGLPVVGTVITETVEKFLKRLVKE